MFCQPLLCLDQLLSLSSIVTLINRNVQMYCHIRCFFLCLCGPAPVDFWQHVSSRCCCCFTRPTWAAIFDAWLGSYLTSWTFNWLFEGPLLLRMRMALLDTGTSFPTRYSPAFGLIINLTSNKFISWSRWFCKYVGSLIIHCNEDTDVPSKLVEMIGLPNCSVTATLRECGKNYELEFWLK